MTVSVKRESDYFLRNNNNVYLQSLIDGLTGNVYSVMENVLKMTQWSWNLSATAVRSVLFKRLWDLLVYCTHIYSLEL
jgi:hypothetical protein